MRNLTIMLLILTLVSCVKFPKYKGDKNDSEDPKTEDNTLLSISQLNIIAGPDESVKVISISSNDSWRIENIPQWCVFSSIRGEKGNFSLSISIKANSSDAKRDSNILIKSGNKEITLSIQQYSALLSASLKIKSGVDISNSNMYFAPLKYNKRIAYSLIAADGYNSPWSILFNYMQGRYINSEVIWHSNMDKTPNGYQPESPLYYTDGCGVKRRFNLGNSICPIRDYMQSEYPYDRRDPDKYFPYLVWDEIYDMLDFDGSVQFHNMREEGGYGSTGVFYDKTNPVEVLQGLKDVQSYVQTRINRKMFVLAVPDGNRVYVEAGNSFQDVLMMTDGSFTNDINLYNVNIENLKRGVFLQGDFEKHKNNFLNYYNRCSDTYYPWVLDVTHSIDNPFNKDLFQIKLVDWIFANFGAQGRDDIWMATPDEIYQYKYLCSTSNLTKSWDGNNMNVNIDIPVKNNDFNWYEYTILVDGVNRIEDIDIEFSEDIIGLSYGISENKLMINVNMDYTLLSRAVQYTSI